MAVAAPSSDYLTELMRLVERYHQRIESQDLRIAELEQSNQELRRDIQELQREQAKETHLRRVLNARIDRGEYDR
jgi:septal ring factor EnvC (AmiA/AmiB activator)